MGTHEKSYFKASEVHLQNVNLADRNSKSKVRMFSVHNYLFGSYVSIYFLICYKPPPNFDCIFNFWHVMFLYFTMLQFLSTYHFDIKIGQTCIHNCHKISKKLKTGNNLISDSTSDNPYF